MPADAKLAQRVRDVLGPQTSFVEKKMMGGLVFMMRGNMCCGVTGQSLLVRVGEEAREAALALPHVRAMEFGGRSPKGFVFVDAPAIATKKTLSGWVQRGLDFAATLPEK